MRIKRFLPALAVVIVLPGASYWAASAGSSTPETASAQSDSRPARLEPIRGTSLHRVILSERAAERLGIETAPVGAVERSPMSEAATTRDGPRTVVDYSAVLYDAHGDTWVYTNPEPLVFVRHRVSIDYIEGDDALLSDGPAPGTMAVTVGGVHLFGAELNGTEFVVGQ